MIPHFLSKFGFTNRRFTSKPLHKSPDSSLMFHIEGIFTESSSDFARDLAIHRTRCIDIDCDFNQNISPIFPVARRDEPIKKLNRELYINDF